MTVEPHHPFNIHKVSESLTPFSMATAPYLNEETEKYLSFYGLNLTEQCECEHRLGHFYIEGFLISAHCYRPKGKANGTVLFQHGYFDHAGIYTELFLWLIKQHYVVFVIDYPGHGLSSGERNAIASFDTYRNVAETAFEMFQHALPRPYIGMGFSTGGAVIIDMLLHPASNTQLLDKAILLAPLVRIAHWNKSKVSFLLGKSFLKSIHRGFQNSSHDPDFLTYVREQDPLQYDRIPLSWVNALHLWNTKMEEDANSSTTPVLLLQGDKDKTVDWKYNVSFLRQHMQHMHVHTIKDGMHHLLRESHTYKEQVYAHMKSFLTIK